MESKTANALIESLDAMLAEAFPESTPAERRERLLAALVEAPATAPVSTLSTAGLRVSLLGRFAAEGVGGRIDEGSWTTQKSMLLFAYLASRAGRAVPDGTLIGTFWPDSDDERARGSLRNALCQVRATVGQAVGSDLQVERNRRSRAVTLTHPVRLDVDEFESGVSEAAELFENDMPAAALDVLLRVMPLYQGEFLEGFEDEWIAVRRAHFAEMHLRGLSLLIRSRLALNDATGAEQVARYALTIDDLREELHGGLIASLVAQGRRGEALRQYREAVAHYEREIGVAPSTLHDLYDELLAEGPVAAPSALQQLRAETRRPSFTRQTAAPRLVRAAC